MHCRSAAELSTQLGDIVARLDKLSSSFRSTADALDGDRERQLTTREHRVQTDADRWLQLFLHHAIEILVQISRGGSNPAGTTWSCHELTAVIATDE